MTLSEKEACEVTKPTHPPWTEDGEDVREDLLGGSSGVMRRIISVGDELQSPRVQANRVAPCCGPRASSSPFLGIFEANYFSRHAGRRASSSHNRRQCAQRDPTRGDAGCEGNATRRNCRSARRE